MSLTLHFHPLSSFCWKALIALYEHGTPFSANSVNLGDETERAALLRLWPLGKFPVLRDEARDQTIPESSIIIEYLDHFYPGATPFISAEPDIAWQTRLRDRFYDLYVHLALQKIVDDRLRPQASRDPHGVAEAKARLRKTYDMIDQQMAGRNWAMGDTFGLVDCSAFPALFYANKVEPFGDAHRDVTAYLERLSARPSIARVVNEAEPYFKLFPQ